MALTFRTRGKAHRAKGNLDLAIADFTRAVELNGEDADAYYSRALVYDGKAEYERAIADYSAAIELSPNWAEAYNGRAWALFKAGKAAEGLADADRSLALKPNDSYALDTRGHIFERLGRRDEAIADFNSALAKVPNLEESRHALLQRAEKAYRYVNGRDDRHLPKFPKDFDLARNLFYWHVLEMWSDMGFPRTRSASETGQCSRLVEFATISLLLVQVKVSAPAVKEALGRIPEYLDRFPDFKRSTQPQPSNTKAKVASATTRATAKATFKIQMIPAMPTFKHFSRVHGKITANFRERSL